MFFCNALDDHTRIERGITTDSPAASRKVFQLARAARLAGLRATVVSLGRGRVGSSDKYDRGRVRRAHGAAIVYLPFSHRRGVSQLLSLTASLPLLARLRRFGGRETIVFYNREPAYLLALVFARLLGFRTALDLEDGEVARSPAGGFSARARFLRWTFDHLCNGGALVATRALAGATHLRPVLPCYGTADVRTTAPDWSSSPLTLLLGGSVMRETGAELLAEAVRTMRASGEPWCRDVRFVVTGKGEGIGLFAQLSSEPGLPSVSVAGRLSDTAYDAVLAKAHVGLALKLNAGTLADTTFPSKVIEFTSHGLLVLTTDISDVREVLGEGAVYLERDEPSLLVQRVREIVADRQRAARIAAAGQEAAKRRCAPAAVGGALRRFVEGSNAT
ncbi:hypothetical protein BH11GEM2_BH11GEM2_07200 [soil metagenome]